MRRPPAFCLLLVLCVPTLFLEGCGGWLSSSVATVGGNSTGAPSSSSSEKVFSGFIDSGGKPVANASIQLYAAGAGDATDNLPLLNQPVRSASDGSFTVNETYSCPSGSSQIYLLSTGGSVNSATVTNNTAATLLAPLGDCNELSTLTSVEVNDLTTVSTISALVSYMETITSVGTVATETQALTNAFASAQSIAVELQQANQDPSAPQSHLNPLEKLNALASMVSDCVQTAGGSAGDGTPCGLLFTSARPVNGSGTPHDTASAILEILKNPTSNVSQIYSLIPSDPAYQPSLTSTPPDWSIAFAPTPPAPTFSPAPGTYSGPQTITLADSDPDAQIYYTTDGSWHQYTGAFSLPLSKTLQALAVANGLSLLASGSYTITAPTLNIAVSSSVAAGQVGQGEVSLSAPAPSGGTVISINDASPSIASISPATFTVAQGQSEGYFSYRGISAGLATISATAPGFTSASAEISVASPVAVSLLPGSVTLTPSQTQQFAASVSGSLNTAVTWSLSPTVGTISSKGLYTAPASITSAQAVTITATSVADSSKSASALVSLTPNPSLSMTLSASSLPSGQSASGTVTLSRPSSVALMLQLSSASTSIATVTPASVSVPAGQTQASFTYAGVAVGSSVLTATASGYVQSSSAVSVLPPAVPSTFFGMSVKSIDQNVPPMAFGTTRSWDAEPNLAWAEINTAPGVYDFSGLDNFIQLNQTRNADMIYTFGRTPQWASSQPTTSGTYGPGQCAPPADMAVWDAYVTAIVTHAAGRIKYWEIWNEPSSPGFYCGDMPTLVTMAAHAWKIIKKIDPTALVLSPPMTDTLGPVWAGDFLYLGGAAYVDVISFHGYSSFQAEDINAIVASYRFVMAANGVANKPLWDTESSWAGNGNLGTPAMATQVGYIAKSYVLHYSLGVSRFVWYAYDGGTTWGGLQNANGTPSLAATAYTETEKWLEGASLSSPCALGINLVWNCGFVRSGGYSGEVLWITGSSLTITLPVQYTEYRDLAGNVHPITNHQVLVSDQPILVETSSLPQS